ncbi:MAG TPA: glycoside hydrolase family 16 protein [Noviherbaspirillum sp.]|nr:glycoside hydrolase family 16 protein [Noviherbaspirillum sp.]
MQTLSLQRFSMSALSCTAAAVLLAACGGGGSGTDAGAGTSTTSAGVEASAVQGNGTTSVSGVNGGSSTSTTGTSTSTSTTGTSTPTTTTGTSTVAPASAWSQCATENTTCTFEGTKEVRYGAGDKWATRTATGSIACNNAVFGDPAFGTQKVCQVSGTAPTQQASTTPAQPPASTTSPVPFGQNASAYELTFADEFNNGFNTSVWNDHIWYEQPNPTKNYTVEDGKLKIWPQRDASGNFFNRTIDTDGKYYQTYGYFEIEAKLPVGKGTWPAFWLFNHIGDRRPEMDVMEAYAGGAAPWGFNDANGVAHPQAYAPTVWKGPTELVGTRQYDTGMDLSAGFHKYAVKWEPNKQTYYFDGREVLVLNTTFSDPMYLMLDLWYGSASGTPDNSTPQGKQNSYEVNYIRAWRFK